MSEFSSVNSRSDLRIASPTKPVLVGHRGLPAYYPENSCEGLLAALDKGASAVEFDVQLSGDKVCVPVHDRDLSRVSEDKRRLVDITREDIPKLSVHEPARFANKFLPTPLLPLSNLCLLLAKREAQFFIELKDESLDYAGAAEFVRLALFDSAPLANRRVIISYSESIVSIARDRFGEKIGWVLKTYDDASLARLERLSPDFAIVNHRKLPQSTLRLPQGPWQWFIYDICEAQTLEWCLARGASYIESWDVSALADHSAFNV